MKGCLSFCARKSRWPKSLETLIKREGTDLNCIITSLLFTVFFLITFHSWPLQPPTPFFRLYLEMVFKVITGAISEVSLVFLGNSCIYRRYIYITKLLFFSCSSLFYHRGLSQEIRGMEEKLLLPPSSSYPQPQHTHWIFSSPKAWVKCLRSFLMEQDHYDG